MISLDDHDDVLDVRGAMKLLRLGRDAIYLACARQQLPHRKIGRLYRFSRIALLRWLESGGVSDACGPQGAQKGQ